MATDKPKEDFDFTLPKLDIWDASIDSISMDMGDNTHYDLTDIQVLGALKRLRWRYKSRMEYLDKEIERLEILNEKTEFPADANRIALAKAERYFREEYPRLLEIALHEAGIEAK